MQKNTKKYSPLILLETIRQNYYNEKQNVKQKSFTRDEVRK